MLAFTNGDIYPSLPKYRVMGSHYHTNVVRRLNELGSFDTGLPDFEALRSAGIEIAGPADRPRDETQLEEIDAFFEGAIRLRCEWLAWNTAGNGAMTMSVGLR